ncbi:hypothetical protein ACFOY2_19225 [Nonomuraea purpurea]|uniref:Uncharacterized protein n=1 Tax=Nonomuraea purpurea TaxID=1849276 RepID=A0ABV8G6K0_9ACTN
MPPASHCELLEWTVPEQSEPDGRVLRRTCDCKGIFFELRLVGDWVVIRRTCREKGGNVIAETERWHAGVAAALWSALLMGHLR